MDKTKAKNKDEEEKRRKLFVGALPKNLPDSLLREYFSKFGELEKAYVVKDSKTGKTRGFGFVIYKNEESLEKAFECDPHIINDK